MNKEKNTENQRRYREKHPEKCRESALAYYYRNREKCLIQHKNWKQSKKGKRYLTKWRVGYVSSGKAKAACKRYYYRNIEKRRVDALDYYYKNKEKSLKKHKEWTNSKNGRKWLKEYRTKRKLKIETNYAIRNAIRRKEIKKLPCEKCGNPKSEGHHPDYSKPLEVIWLCGKCHKKWHKENRNSPANRPK